MTLELSAGWLRKELLSRQRVWAGGGMLPCHVNSAPLSKCGSGRKFGEEVGKRVLKKSPGNNACFAWAREMGEIEAHSVRLRKGRLWRD